MIEPEPLEKFEVESVIAGFEEYFRTRPPGLVQVMPDLQETDIHSEVFTNAERHTHFKIGEQHYLVARLCGSDFQLFEVSLQVMECIQRIIAQEPTSKLAGVALGRHHMQTLLQQAVDHEDGPE